MNIRRSRGLALLPQEVPNESLLGVLREPYYYWETREHWSRAQRLAILWTLAIDDAFLTREIWRFFPGYKFASCGFADPDVEADAFGVFIYVEPNPNYQNPRRPIFELPVGGHFFPVFLRYAAEALHGLPPIHPMSGTATCWARSNRLALEEKIGFLTAKHVIPSEPLTLPNGEVISILPVGSKIPIVQPSGVTARGTLLDLGPEGIDAALIEPPSNLQPELSLKPLHCPQFIPQWTDVAFQGRHSDMPIKTKVVEVQLGRGSMHPSIPLRIFLADPGKPGDSGALVVDSQGNGIGIYMGSVLSFAGHKEGYCQHLAQVAYVMNLTIQI